MGHRRLGKRKKRKKERREERKKGKLEEGDVQWVGVVYEFVS